MRNDPGPSDHLLGFAFQMQTGGAGGSAHARGHCPATFLCITRSPQVNPCLGGTPVPGGAAQRSQALEGEGEVGTTKGLIPFSVCQTPGTSPTASERC